MVNTKFEAYKLTRAIKTSGVVATVSRAPLNEFGEPGDTPLLVGTFPGLFHNDKSYVMETTSDSGLSRSSVGKVIGRPMIMCLMESVVGLDLEVGDKIVLSSDADKVYELVELNDIQEWGIIVDISLRLVDDGSA